MRFCKPVLSFPSLLGVLADVRDRSAGRTLLYSQPLPGILDVDRRFSAGLRGSSAHAYAMPAAGAPVRERVGEVRSDRAECILSFSVGIHRGAQLARLCSSPRRISTRDTRGKRGFLALQSAALLATRSQQPGGVSPSSLFTSGPIPPHRATVRLPHHVSEPLTPRTRCFSQHRARGGGGPAVLGVKPRGRQADGPAANLRADLL